MKLQTLETLVTIKTAKNPFPPLQVIHLTINYCNHKSSAKALNLGVLRLYC